jgi:TolA-binding protein
MARPVTPLGSLGAKVAATLEKGGEERSRAIEEARQQFSINGRRVPRSEKRIGRALVMAMAAALSVAAMAWFSLHRRPGPLEFKVDGAAGIAQTWLAAPAERPLVVAFSEGTVVKVQPLSRARVVDTDPFGANIALESGRLSAEVVHKPESAWHLIAGPFAVRVTGTRFDLRWNAASQKFSITVLEGSVGVSGSIVGIERPVRAGETLAASVTQGKLELIIAGDRRAAAMSDDTAASQGIDGSESQAFDEPEPEPSSVGSGSRETLARDPAAGGWRDFAKKGDLRQAFAAADALGFQSVCEMATPAELLVLGDGARLSGRADRAEEALLTLRRKYRHDPRRAAAAFALGKVAFDQRHAYAQAAEWFARCIREQPSGPLVREAWGRQIEALRNAGDAAGAQRAAREYLSQYPDGPHADIARSVLK